MKDNLRYFLYGCVEQLAGSPDCSSGLNRVGVRIPPHPLKSKPIYKYFSHTIELFKKYNIFNKKDTTMQNLNNILLNARTEGDNPCVSEKLC